MVEPRGSRAVMLRRLLAVTVIGIVLAAASPAPAGGMVLQFPLITNGLIFFVTSGFSDHPIMLFGRPTTFPLIIQPILLVRKKVFAAPRSEERRVGKECRSRWS